MDHLVHDCLTSFVFFSLLENVKIVIVFINKVFTFMYVIVLFMCISKCLTLVDL